MTKRLVTLDAEFRFHFGEDEDAAGRVFDAWKAKHLELYKRPEVYGDPTETRLRVEVLGEERFAPDGEPITREGFVSVFCGKVGQPTHGETVARILVDREHFATWAKGARRKDQPTEVRAEWKKRALGLLSKRPDISAEDLMEACGWSRKSNPQGNLMVNCTSRGVKWDTFQQEISRLRPPRRT